MVKEVYCEKEEWQIGDFINNWCMDCVNKCD